MDAFLASVSRRQFVVAGRMALLSGRLLAGVPEAPKIVVRDRKIISMQPEFYHGWPTVARQASGRLVVTWSGRREAHVCPFGTVEMMTSRDGGETWSWPRTILDSATDDRDSGVLETAQGTLLATTFTSLAYEAALARAKDWPTEKLQAWKAAQARLTGEERKADLGEWVVRSTDNGVTWSPRIATVVNSPHGPIQLKDGRLLYAGKQLWTVEKKVGVSVSADDGQTWRWLSEIPARAGDQTSEYHELHAVEAADGRIIAHIRNHNVANKGETLQTESADGGKSWSEPQAIGVWGLPSHLLRMGDGRLLMTYGYRRAPFGNQARISADQGRTWSAPITLSDDGTSGDLGYPSTVELKPGHFLTAWYEHLKDSPKAVLRQMRWEFS